MTAVRIKSAARSAWLMARFARHLKNWRAVGSAYLDGRPIPELRLRNGVRLASGPDDAPVLMLFEVFADGVYRRRLRGASAGAVIDLGANIGAAAVDFAAYLPDVVVHCYEPSPKTRDVLQRNIAMNGLDKRVRVFDEAAGRGPGMLLLWVNGPSVAATAYSADAPFPGCVALDMPVVGLDEIVRRVDRPPIVLLKIDVEGAEADLLEGASVASFRDIQNVAIEFHTDLSPDADRRCRAVLERAGFECSQFKTESHRGMLYGWRR